MQKIFNTTFEVSLRLILLLAENEGKELTIDRIAAMDFIAIYSSFFGITEESLHGENEFGLSEFASRRHTTKAALRELVLDETVKARSTAAGICYSISETGKVIADKMNTPYATEYKEITKLVWKKYSDYSDTVLMQVINQVSESSIEEGEL